MHQTLTEDERLHIIRIKVQLLRGGVSVKLNFFLYSLPKYLVAFSLQSDISQNHPQQDLPGCIRSGRVGRILSH
jgi:hypothetical protein